MSPKFNYLDSSTWYSHALSLLNMSRAMEMFVLSSCVRGHHVYKNIWLPHVGEELICTPEFGNETDPHAVATVT